MAPAEEACHYGYAGHIAWLPGQCLSHCWQRQRIVHIRVAECVISRHANVPGIVLLCAHSLQSQKRNVLTNERPDHHCAARISQAVIGRTRPGRCAL